MFTDCFGGIGGATAQRPWLKEKEGLLINSQNIETVQAASPLTEESRGIRGSFLG